MKHRGFWAIIVFAVVMTSGLVAFATERSKFTPVEPSSVEGIPPPPENATVITGLKSIPFNLFLDTREITVSKGQSLNVTVTIYFTEKANISLTVGTEDYTPLAPNLTGLPPGIMACFDQTEVTMQASSEVM